MNKKLRKLLMQYIGRLLKLLKKNDTRIILLTNGYQVIVNAVDYEMLNKFKWYAKKAGDGKVYAARSVRNGKKVQTIYMHRFILTCPSHMEVDHKDKNRLNDCRSNLEMVTKRENLRRRWR